MRTLRSRLVVSHILPILLIVPLVAIVLTYILETQIVLAGISDELEQYAELTADMASEQPAIWSDSAQAEHFVTLYAVRSRAHVMLLDQDGRVLASSHPGRASMVGLPEPSIELARALSGEQQVQVNYTQRVEAEIVQVLVPVMGPDQRVLGVVRLSQYVADVHDQLVQLRTLVLLILAVALALAVAIALVLALNLGRSLRRVTDAIYGVSTGLAWETLPVQGTEEIRKLLLAFNSLIDKLRTMEESRRQLLANLVHELGRPIGALQSAVQALISGAEQDPGLRRELLEGMETQIHRLSPLLDSLTDLHGQVLGTLELNRVPVALSTWLPGTVLPWRQAAHDKGLHWSTDIPDSLPAMEIDPDRLAQALGNLLSNAIKYTAEGRISVSAAVADGGVSITVSDTGIGISPAEQDEIFEPFYRSQRDTRFPQGMGLGLSIARDLVHAHQGRLNVVSVQGEGSSFTIWLPGSVVLETAIDE